jgi:NOL1/NOP2/fmu family ribosome biogenesis protein
MQRTPCRDGEYHNPTLSLMKTTITVLWLLFTSFCQAQTKPYKATIAQTVALKKQAEESAVAVTQQNYKQIAYFTYPKITELMGGADKMQEKFTAAIAQMQNMGVVIKSVTVGNIDAITKSHGDLYSVVQDIIQLSNSGSIITSSSYLLAYSHNNGLRWYFTDSTPLKRQNVKKLFPTYPDGLVIPETKNPFGGGK